MRRSPLHLLLGLGFSFALAAVTQAATTIGLADAVYATRDGTRFAPGQSLTLRQESGPTGDRVSYQWFHDDLPIVGATAPSFAFSALTATDTGNYRLRVTGESFSELSLNTLTLNVLPLPAPAVDPTFTATPPSAAHQGWRLLQVADDGSLFLVSATSGPTTYYVHKLDRTGQLLRTTTLPTATGVPTAILPDESILTNTAHLIAPLGFDRTLTWPGAFEATQPIEHALPLPDNGFYLQQGNHIAKYSPDGSLDSNFNYTLPATAQIWDALVDYSGNLYLSLRYPNYESGSYVYGSDRFVRVLPDGRQDPGFAPARTSILYSRLHVSPLIDGRLVVHEIYHGYNQIFVLSPTGALDQSITPLQSVSPEPVTVDGRNLVIYAPSYPFNSRYRITPTDLELDTTYYPGYQPTNNVSFKFTPDGALIITGYFDQWENHPTHNLARLRTDLHATAPLAPAVYLSPPGFRQPLLCGTDLTLTSTTSGDGPFTYQWLMLDGQPPPVSADASTLELHDLSLAQLGRYQVRVTGPGGTVLSNVITLNVDDQPTRLANLSGRAIPGAGERTMMGGLSIAGHDGYTGNFLLRGVGPSLANYGLNSFLPDPVLTVYDSAGAVVVANDNWRDSDNASQVAYRSLELGAFPLPDPSLDAGLIFGTTDATHLSAHLTGKTSNTGAALLEVYEYAGPAFPLTNLSLRAYSSAGDGTAIAGFVIKDPLGYDRPVRLLLRAIGPGLADYGIAQFLPQPRLQLHDEAGTVISIGHAPTAETNATAAQVGAFALATDSADSVLLIELPPGAYTMTAPDDTSHAGVVLLEIYLVP